MTKILIDEAVVRLALKALIDYEEQCDWEWGSHRTIEQIDCDGETPESITALRQALEQPAPAQAWVGLTDEEIDNYLDKQWLGYGSYHDCFKEVIRWQEAKLKEKNTKVGAA